MDFYSNISNYYDKIFPLNETQLRFILSRLSKFELDSQILDIGCGTGNLAIELYNTGYQVTGMDLKGEMIEIAKEKAAGTNITFIRGNMCEVHKYNNDNLYDSIICLGNTLVHLTSVGQVKRCIHKLKDLINPGGSLIIQIINYDRILGQNIDHLETIDNDSVRFVREYVFDPEDYKILFKTNLIIKEEGNKSLENKIKLLPLRKIEMDDILSDFKNVNYFGSFKGEEFNENSLHMIIEAFV